MYVIGLYTYVLFPVLLISVHMYNMLCTKPEMYKVCNVQHWSVNGQLLELSGKLVRTGRLSLSKGFGYSVQIAGIVHNITVHYISIRFDTFVIR